MVNRKNIDYNLKPLRRRLREIRGLIREDCESESIRYRSQKLKARAVAGEPAEALQAEAFALAYEAAKTALGLITHDVQLLAALAMADGRIIELPTGEGKTLAAVFTAYLMALPGRGMHVLTANDYLAKRDAGWMKPVYDLLDVSVGAIGESTDREARKAAYGADITYITAKEAGFDYLRGFLAYDEASVVQRPFHFAIIDEADSILIDEARNPLVVSGEDSSDFALDKQIFRAAGKMLLGRHFNMDEHGSELYLEEAGIAFLEEQLGLSDIYEDGNLPVMEKAEAVLQALHQLKRDVDYIVRDGRVRIVDHFTGRVAENRQWTDALQAAVEMKEGLAQTAKGRIMNSITLQNFLNLYPGFCGMSGTARQAASEFLKFYNTSVTVIPPDRPCIRTDHPDWVFVTKADKYRALVAEIKKVHAAGQPVLIGTCSIEESESLADMLRGDIKNLSVLNAKQDAEEAEIIAEAGMPGAVTISTNMAGRGVDIRLGGTDEKYYGKVCALGGLYVIGTGRHESVRIDNQLRGRAGRQGDPGMSRFFISLDDDLLVRYGLSGVIPQKYTRMAQDGPLRNGEIVKAVARTQSIVEAQTFDAKITLSRYSRLVEDQRLLVHNKRESILLGEMRLSIMEQERPDQYRALLERISEDEYAHALRQITLFALNRCWSDHLQFIDSVMDEIRVISAVREDPLVYYNRKLNSGFEQLEKHVRRMILEIFDAIIIRDGCVDLAGMHIAGPTSSRTYIVHDGAELQNLFSGAAAIGAAAFAAPLFFISLLTDRLRRSRDD